MTLPKLLSSLQVRLKTDKNFKCALNWHCASQISWQGPNMKFFEHYFTSGRKIRVRDSCDIYVYMYRKIDFIHTIFHFALELIRNPFPLTTFFEIQLKPQVRAQLFLSE